MFDFISDSVYYVVTWSMMISGLARNARSDGALELCEVVKKVKLQNKGIFN